MMGIISGLLPLIFTAAEWFLKRSLDNREMQDLFYKFVERIQGEYLKSAKLREAAKARLAAIMEKPFVEAP